MRLIRENDEVFYIKGDTVSINERDIAGLIEKAGLNPRKRARICMHGHVGHRLHEMIIVHHRGVYVRPHYHMDKTESFHILAGDADIVLFNEEGKVSAVIPVGAYGTDQTFYCRLPEGCHHSMIVHSEIFVVHEITGGPFRREQTFFPDWAPPENDHAGIERFFRQVTAAIDVFKHTDLKG